MTCKKFCEVIECMIFQKDSVADQLFADDDGNETTRPLGLVVARGTLLVLVSPVDGSEEIANPFVQQEE